MSPRRWTFALGALLLLACSARRTVRDIPEATAPRFPEETASAIAERAKATLDRDKLVGLCIGAYSRGRISILGLGRQDPTDPAPPDEGTLFEIGSITKTFTALLLADLVRSRTLDLDDPIGKWLPENVPPRRTDRPPILLRHLASHTSGLPRMPSNLPFLHDAPETAYEERHLHAFLKNHQPKRAPGSQYQYSNLGFGLLSHILERASGKSFEERVQERICRPLGMSDTSMILSADRRARLALPHTAEGFPTRITRFGVLAGAGALRSTVRDMLKYLQANLGHGDASLVELLEMCHEPRESAGDMNIGLAWHESALGDGPTRVVWHNGQTDGYHAYMGFVKETRTGVVILANSSQEGIDALGVEILRLLNP